MPTGWPHLVPSLIVTWPVSASVVPPGPSRLLASGAELCARLCPPQAQRWRSENFERPVDLEGSGDDDSFPDDELDNLYSGSGSGCKYLPSPLPGVWAVLSAGCLQGPMQAHFHDRGRGGVQAGGQTILLGLEAGPRDLRAQDSPLPMILSLRAVLTSPLQASQPPEGTQTLLSDPGDSTALTSCRHLVTMSGGQWHILEEIIWLTQLGSGGHLPSKQRWPGAGLGNDEKGQTPPPCLGQPGSMAWPWERPAEPCKGREVP